MIHIEDTSITRRTMVTSLRFEHVTHETISSSFILSITQVEAPEDGDLTRVSSHRLEKGPDKHDK